MTRRPSYRHPAPVQVPAHPSGLPNRPLTLNQMDVLLRGALAAHAGLGKLVESLTERVQGLEAERAKA